MGVGDSEVDVVETFNSFLKKDLTVSPALAAMDTLSVVLAKSSAGTLQELIAILIRSKNLMKCQCDSSATSVVSGCELYLRFITLAANDELESKNWDSVRDSMLKRGRDFTGKLLQARPKIAALGSSFLQDECCKILVHGKSRVVLETLRKVGEKANKHVFVTEAGGSGKGMAEELKAFYDVTTVADSAVGYIMSQVDLVLVGAEGVVESGGIINKIGTYTLALCAKALNKPFYVVCESFKFVRLYPLNQQDLPDEFKYFASTIAKTEKHRLQYENPRVDYTPPDLITLLFTDLGILTPSAVSDELIKLYL